MQILKSESIGFQRNPWISRPESRFLGLNPQIGEFPVGSGVPGKKYPRNFISQDIKYDQKNCILGYDFPGDMIFLLHRHKFTENTQNRQI